MTPSKRRAFNLLSSLSLTDPTSASTRVAFGYPQRRNFTKKQTGRVSIHSFNPSLSPSSSICITRRNLYISSIQTSSKPSRSDSDSDGWVADHPLAPRRESGTDMSLHPSGINHEVFEELTEEYDFNLNSKSMDKETRDQQESSTSSIKQPLLSASHLLTRTILASTSPSNSIPVATSLLKDFLNLGTRFVGEECKVVYLLAVLRSLRLGFLKDSLTWLEISPQGWRDDLDSLEIGESLYESVKQNKEEDFQAEQDGHQIEKILDHKVKLELAELLRLILIQALNSPSTSTNLDFLQKLTLACVRKGYFENQCLQKHHSGSNSQLFMKMLERIFKHTSDGKESSGKSRIEFWKEIVQEEKISRMERDEYFKSKGCSTSEPHHSQDQLLSKSFNLIIRTLILSGNIRETLRFISLSPSFILDSEELQSKGFEATDGLGFELDSFTYRILIEELLKRQYNSKVGGSGSDLEITALDLERGLKERIALNSGNQNQNQSRDQNQSISASTFIPSYLSVDEIKERLFAPFSSQDSNNTESHSTSSSSKLNSVDTDSPIDSKLIPLLEQRDLFKARDLILSTLESSRKRLRKEKLQFLIPTSEDWKHSQAQRLKPNFNHLPSTKTLARFINLVHSESKIQLTPLLIERNLKFLDSQTLDPASFLLPIRRSLQESLGGKFLFETAILYSKIHQLDPRLDGKNHHPNYKKLLDAICFYRETFFMGENNGPAGIDEELFQIAGIRLERLKAEKERRSRVDLHEWNRARNGMENQIPQISDQIKNSRLSGNDGIKITPSSHTIPLILRCLIRLTLIDNRRTNWFKIKAKRSAHLNPSKHDKKFERLNSLYTTWLSKAFPTESENSANVPNPSERTDEKRDWRSNQGSKSQQFNPDSNPAQFLPSTKSSQVTAHCFDQFIKGFLKLDHENLSVTSSYKASLASPSSSSSTTTASSEPSIRISQPLSKSLEILNQMESKGIKPTISTWNLILSSVAKEGRNLIFTNTSKEERADLKLGKGNGLGWKRILELAKNLGIGQDYLDSTSNSSSISNSSLPRANLVTYTTLLKALINVPRARGGPMILEALEIRNLLLQVAERNSKHLLSSSSKQNRIHHHASNGREKIHFTLEDLERNPTTRNLLRELEEIEQREKEARESRETQEKMVEKTEIAEEKEMMEKEKGEAEEDGDGEGEGEGNHGEGRRAPARAEDGESNERGRILIGQI